MKKYIKKYLTLLFIIVSMFITGCSIEVTSGENSSSVDNQKTAYQVVKNDDGSYDISSIPEYTGEAYAVVNSNVPYFTDSELTDKSYEQYGKLDSLGRCTQASASVGKDLMPTGKRKRISRVKPTGWHSVKYKGVDGEYLYNRCHLIGYQLTAENANWRNLITGTRYLNTEGMLPFENMVSDYVKETKNHVMYRVTPIFEGENLVATGVLMEAKSVEDGGKGVQFNVFCYNVQPGIEIDYSTGDSHRK